MWTKDPNVGWILILGVVGRILLRRSAGRILFGCSSGCRKHSGVAVAVLLTQSLAGDISLVNVGEIYWCNVAVNQFTSEI